MWRVHQEAAVGFGVPRAILMQIAHPWVAQAVIDHSTWNTQPCARLLGTVGSAAMLTFGSRAQADEVARRIRTMHAHITGELPEDVGKWRKGTRYRADEPQALLWVLSTLIDTALCLYESCFGPLPPADEKAYIADASRLGALLGLPQELVPPDRASLDDYMQRVMHDGTIAVGTAGRELARGLTSMRIPELGPLYPVYHRTSVAVAKMTLPYPILQLFQFAPGPGQTLSYRCGGIAARALIRRLPDRIRTDPLTRTRRTRSEMEQDDSPIDYQRAS
jgi:uncharacterized protein (DUF2236 family)